MQPSPSHHFFEVLVLGNIKKEVPGLMRTTQARIEVSFVMKSLLIMRVLHRPLNDAMMYVMGRRGNILLPAKKINQLEII